MTEDKADKIEAAVEKLALEVRRGSKVIRNNPVVEVGEVRATLDRWDGIRDIIFKTRLQVQQSLRQAEEDYKDRMREFVAGKKDTMNSRSLASYEERKAYYETENLDAYRAYIRIEQLHKTIMDFSYYLKDKERWLDTLRRELREDQKREDYIANSEYDVNL